jgi:hypothetical protein
MPFIPAFLNPCPNQSIGLLEGNAKKSLAFL